MIAQELGRRSITDRETNGQSLGVASSAERSSLANVNAGSTSTASDSDYGKGVSFTRKPRWDDPVYRREKHIRTTGLLLSPFYDQHIDDKKVPVTLKSALPRTVVFDVNSLTAGIDLNPDWGPKASVQAEVRNSPRKLASVFKSKKEVGFNMPPPTSGTKIGPGSYPGAEVPSLVVKNPKQRSACFLIPRPYFQPKPAVEDSTGELPKFSDIHTQGPFFVMEGKVNAKPIQQMTQKRFQQIYPRHRMAKLIKEH
jgi:hypothetical protein